jgi:drug/metabolite transporter (DMT)-like permease
VQVHAHPVGLSLLVNCMGAIVCLGVCWMRGVQYFPKADELKFFCTWAILYSVLNQVLIYWLSMRMDAAVVSVFTVLEGLFIFLAAAVLGIEKPSLRRCGGLLIGLVGMLCLFAVGQFGDAQFTSLLLLVGLLIPVSYATESLYIAARRPAAIDPLMAVAMVMTCSVPFLLALAYATDDFMPVSFPPGPTEFLAFLIMLCTLLANLAYFVLIKIAGSVFAGQVSYFNALSGIGWGVAVLGETVSWHLMLALGLILCGLLLVRPAPQVAKDREINGLQPWPAE